MISPAKLDKLPAEVVNLIQRLQEDIISDVCRRVTKANYLTPTAEWQLYKANQLRLSYNDVNRRIARQLKAREKTVQELYTETVKQALKEDADIFRIAAAQGKLPGNTGAKIDSYFRSAAFSRLLSKGLKNCKGSVRNLCSSMAAEANRQLSDAMDYAHLKVISGAYSYNDAIYSAVKELADKGITRVEYPSGRRDNADVCVRRAVLSSVNKSCCDIQLDLAREVGSRYVEVTAHFGARPSHAEWQGRIYSLVKGDKKYPYFYEATGYGTGEGLGGWNCRHNFFPYFEGIDTPYHSLEFTKTENAEYYALTQKQRGYERAVRKSKRELAALDGARQSVDDPALRAKLDGDFARGSVTLKNREDRLDSFIKDNGLQKDNSRVRVVGFGKSVSQKAVRDNKNILTWGNGDVTIGLKIYCFRQDIARGAVITSVDKSNQQNHTYGKIWKNQVKQAMKSNGQLAPKSVLAKGLDPQKIIDKYAGKGDSYSFKGANKYPDEYITLPFVAGRTYNKKTGKYEETHRVQLKYNESKGFHVFPVLED